MTLRLAGTRLLVDDYAAAFRFYRDVLGFPVTWGDEATGYASFDAGPCGIAIFGRRAMADAIGEGGKPLTASSQDTFALTFPVEDVDAEYERLRARGVRFLGAPVNRPGWGERTAHFRDPSGNLIELSTSLAGTWVEGTFVPDDGPAT